MTLSRFSTLVLLAVACGHDHARPHVPRRWDTSQRDFRVPPSALVAVAAPPISGGTGSDYLRSFLDEFDMAADSIERLGGSVGVSFRDSLRVAQPPDTFRLASLPPGTRTGYYFLMAGRPPRFVAGPWTAPRLLRAWRAGDAVWLRDRRADAVVLKPSEGDTIVIATATVVALVPPGVPLPPDTMARARIRLEGSGIRLRVVSGDSVLVRRRREVRWLSTGGVRDRVLYYTLSPTRGPALTFSPMTDSALAESARRFLSNADMPSPVHWDSAARAIRRLPITAFALPAELERELAFMGCSVPQSFADSAPHNVIKGAFAARGQVDWAVLCSRDGTSTIVVHWGGPARCPSEFPPIPDMNFLETIGDGKIGYSREIVLADSARIANIEVYGEDSVGTLARSAPEHDGIEDIFVEKASTVWYCTDGAWVGLGGAD